MEQLPENYVEYSFKAPILEYSELSYQEPIQTSVDAKKLGKETLDIQKDTTKIDNVEQQMRKQTQQKTEPMEVKSTGRDSFRENLKVHTKTTNEQVKEALKQFEYDLEHGVL